LGDPPAGREWNNPPYRNPEDPSAGETLPGLPDHWRSKLCVPLEALLENRLIGSSLHRFSHCPSQASSAPRLMIPDIGPAFQPLDKAAAYGYSEAKFKNR
jgi:hypothetical protein